VQKLIFSLKKKIIAHIQELDYFMKMIILHLFQLGTQTFMIIINKLKKILKITFSLHIITKKLNHLNLLKFILLLIEKDTNLTQMQDQLLIYSLKSQIQDVYQIIYKDQKEYQKNISNYKKFKN
jgi:uncharacterized protein YihD (DUF1040 family)